MIADRVPGAWRVLQLFLDAPAIGWVQMEAEMEPLLGPVALRATVVALERDGLLERAGERWRLTPTGRAAVDGHLGVA